MRILTCHIAQWHPIRPLIASVSTLGLIHVWVTGITENWSAYAPGFEELDENVEYQEKEDEFDIVRPLLLPLPPPHRLRIHRKTNQSSSDEGKTSKTDQSIS